MVSAMIARSHAGGMRRTHGSQSIPSSDRDHADVEAEQRHQGEEAEIRLGRLGGGADLVRERAAGRGQQHDLVGLALDPRLADA